MPRALRSAKQVYHFAAQVAVTTSITNPALDLEVNACGTFNLLEELRALHNPPPLVFPSTNKVYGNLCDVSLSKNCTRYEPEEAVHYVRELAESDLVALGRRARAWMLAEHTAANRAAELEAYIRDLQPWHVRDE